VNINVQINQNHEAGIISIVDVQKKLGILINSKKLNECITVTFCKPKRGNRKAYQNSSNEEKIRLNRINMY
jgi:hypothetical protein